MLVLSRRCAQQIRIGDDITVTILEVDGKSVRIGIDAPKQVPIVREEALLRSPEPRSRKRVLETIC